MEGAEEKKRENRHRATVRRACEGRADVGDLVRKQERGDAVGGVGVEYARILSEVGAPC